MNPADLANLAASLVAALTGVRQTGADWLDHRSAETEHEHEELVNLRLLYAEVLFNALTLAAGSKVSPPRLIVVDTAYRSILAANGLARSSLTPEEATTVAAPYAFVPGGRLAFEDDWMTRMVGCVRGSDYSVLETLAGFFRDAEAVLRRHAWDDEDQERLAKEPALVQALLPIEGAPLVKRLRNAIRTTPGYLMAAIMVWSVRNGAQALDQILDERRQRR